MNPKMNNAESSHRSVAVVTGATGMLGQSTARALAARGADVVLIARNPDKGARLLAELERATSAGRHRLVLGDLGSIEDVRRMAAEIDRSGGGVRALIHTAAALKPTREETAEGHEAMFATNVLSRLLLTHELRGALKRAAPSRVVLQSELMKGMPAIVRYVTFPFGRTAEPAAEALSELAWGEAHDGSNATPLQP